MTEPTEEEIEAVAWAMGMDQYPTYDGTDLVRFEEETNTYFRAMARAAILALDEHRAAEAPKHPYEVAGVTKDGVKILKPIPRQSVSAEPPNHKDDF